MVSISRIFKQLRKMAADGEDTGSTGADNDVSTAKDLEKMTHETAGGWPITAIKGELAAAGLVGGVMPGNVQAVQEVTEGMGHLGGELIDITGDKELNGHGQIVAVGLGL